MSLRLTEIRSAPKIEPFYVIETQLSEKLTIKDYSALAPVIDLLAKKQPIRFIVELNDFHGWISGDLWEDTRFASRSFYNVERIAIVGENPLEQGIAMFCKPFSSAAIRYFNSSDIQLARGWIWQRIEDDNSFTTSVTRNSILLT
jgi:hypothetical protein